jgi:hypothetical protein
MRLAATTVAAVLLAALAAGCGSSDDSGSTGSETTRKQGAGAPVGATARSCALDAGGAVRLRATGVSCGKAQRVALAWGRSAACAADPDVSRSSCSVGGYRCLGARTERGLVVGCARPGRSVAFISKHRP